jgi:signal transduction histidine kinase
MAAHQGVERGAKLSEQLLAFSRRGQRPIQIVSVDELIDSLKTLLGELAGDAVSVDIQRGPEPWFCNADPRQLSSALANLAANAGEAMPLGGVLTVATSSLRLDQKVARSLSGGAGDYVVVSVKDTGTGIDPKLLSRVSEPFFTTKAGGAGTGLGLSQVYGFATQSGGFVTIESEPAVGTTVRIHLPRTMQR